MSNFKVGMKVQSFHLSERYRAGLLIFIILNSIPKLSPSHYIHPLRFSSGTILMGNLCPFVFSAYLVQSMYQTIAIVDYFCVHGVILN